MEGRSLAAVVAEPLMKLVVELQLFSHPGSVPSLLSIMIMYLVSNLCHMHLAEAMSRAFLAACNEFIYLDAFSTLLEGQ